MGRARKGRGRPQTGRALSAAERMRRYRARRKAAGLKPVIQWLPPGNARGNASFSTHRVLEARSLALHCRIAQKIMKDPSVIDIARRNIKTWSRKTAGAMPQYLVEWQRILERPRPQVAALITEQSEKAARLRQSSPAEDDVGDDIDVSGTGIFAGLMIHF